MPANFGSDNSSGVHPSIIEALAKASVGSAPAYGADALTKKVESRLASLFECEVTVLLVRYGHSCQLYWACNANIAVLWHLCAC